MPSRSPLPACHPAEPVHDYYYRHMYPHTALVLEPRAVLDVFLDWLLSRAPAVPDAAPIVEPDCVVLAQSGARQPPPRPPLLALSSRQLMLAFVAALSLAAVLSRRSVWKRFSKGLTIQRARDIGSSIFDLLATSWALLSAYWTILLSSRHRIWPKTTTRGVQTIDRPDQDTWLRRFTSTRPPSKESSVKLPPDWHDWFKRSPPKPSDASLTPPLPIAVLPLGRAPLTPRPTPLTPTPASRHRVPLRPKANRARSPASTSSSGEEAPSARKLKESEPLLERAQSPAPHASEPAPGAFSRILKEREPPLSRAQSPESASSSDDEAPSGAFARMLKSQPLRSAADLISRGGDDDDLFDYELLKASLNEDSDFEPIAAVTFPGEDPAPVSTEQASTSSVAAPAIHDEVARPTEAAVAAPDDAPDAESPIAGPSEAAVALPAIAVVPAVAGPSSATADGNASAASADDDDQEDAPKKKKTRRSGRKWKRRIENANDAQAVAAML